MTSVLSGQTPPTLFSTETKSCCVLTLLSYLNLSQSSIFLSPDLADDSQ